MILRILKSVGIAIAFITYVSAGFFSIVGIFNDDARPYAISIGSVLIVGSISVLVYKEIKEKEDDKTPV